MFNQFIAELEFDFKHLFKYKIRRLLWPFVIVPVSWVIEIILMGKYIDKVTFYGKVVPYLYVVFFGIVIVELFMNIVPEILYTVSENPVKISLIDIKQWILATSLSNSFLWILKILIIFIPLYLKYSLPVNLLLYSLFSIFLVLPSILGVGLLLSFFTFRFRNDADPIWWSISSVAWATFPVYYSLSVFNDALRTLLEEIFPIFAVMEELRKLAILGYCNVTILSVSLVVSIFYLIFGWIAFKWSLNMSKKSGRLFMK